MTNFCLQVKNNSNEKFSFFIVQKPAAISPSSSTLISRSIGLNTLSSGATWNLSLDANIYAGAVGPSQPNSSKFISSIAANQATTSTTTDFVSIPTNSGNRFLTNLTISPLALSPPTVNNDIPSCYGISVPAYVPSSIQNQEIYIGGAFFDETNTMILSYSIVAPSQTTISFSPYQIFYVSQGTTASNMEVNISQLSNYAICDFTDLSSKPTIVATYSIEGTWNVCRTG
jgi:hypothetical protein